MIKLLHIVAISALIVSAGYAYSIKYDTLYYAEQVAKLKSRVQREREAIHSSRTRVRAKTMKTASRKLRS